MIKKDIIEDVHFQEFLNSRQVRESTKEQYIIRIFNYCVFLDHYISIFRLNDSKFFLYV